MLYTRTRVFKNYLTILYHTESNNLTRVFCAPPVEDMFPHNQRVSSVPRQDPPRMLMVNRAEFPGATHAAGWDWVGCCVGYPQPISSHDSCAVGLDPRFLV